MAWSALPWPCHRCDFHRALAQHQPRSRTHNTARKVPKVRRPPGHELINAHRAGHQAVWRHFENCSSISTTCRVGLHALCCFCRTMPHACCAAVLVRAQHHTGGLLLHELLEAEEATPIRLRALCGAKAPSSRSGQLMLIHIPALPSSAAHTSSMDSSSSALGQDCQSTGKCRSFLKTIVRHPLTRTL